MDYRLLAAGAGIFCLCGCVSYYDDYDRYSSAGSYYGYSVPVSGFGYNSPLRLKPLSEHDFYMMNNYPGDYWNMQLWSGISELSRFSIHSIIQGIAR